MTSAAFVEMQDCSSGAAAVLRHQFRLLGASRHVLQTRDPRRSSEVPSISNLYTE